MAHRKAPLLMTLSDFQGHSRIANLFNCYFSYSCAAIDKVSLDLERRAVPLRQLSFLLKPVTLFR